MLIFCIFSGKQTPARSSDRVLQPQVAGGGSVAVGARAGLRALDPAALRGAETGSGAPRQLAAPPPACLAWLGFQHAGGEET